MPSSAALWCLSLQTPAVGLGKITYLIKKAEQAAPRGNGTFWHYRNSASSSVSITKVRKYEVVISIYISETL